MCVLYLCVLLLFFVHDCCRASGMRAGDERRLGEGRGGGMIFFDIYLVNDTGRDHLLSKPPRHVKNHMQMCFIDCGQWRYILRIY